MTRRQRDFERNDPSLRLCPKCRMFVDDMLRLGTSGPDAEIARLKVECRNLNGAVRGLEHRLVMLTAAFRRYAKHHEDCPSLMSKHKPCGCRLDQALADYTM